MLIFVFVKQSVNTMSVNKNNYCLILAGGKGRRLWPCSREDRPKQFLDFFRQDARFFSRLTTAWPDLFLLKIFISVQTTSITTW